MRILGISCSQRKGRSCYRLLEEAIKGVREVEPSAETKIIEFVKLNIGSCVAVCCDADTCGKIPFECNLKDDLQTVFGEMKLAEGILIASPRYFIVPSKLQAFMERLYCVHFFSKEMHPAHPFPLADKPCGLLTVSGSGEYSTMPLLEHLEKFCLWMQMRPIMTKIWPFRGVVAKSPASEDTQALEHAKTLGQTVMKTVKEGR